MKDRRRHRIEDVIRQRQKGIIVVLEDIHDPHNAAAILRTCDALGIQTVYFIFEKESPYNPKKVGKATSSSANKWLDFCVFHSTLQCIDTLKQNKYHIIVTSLTNTSASLLDFRCTKEKIAIFISNEHDGVSKIARKAADTILTIPMAGFVQSLNVSVAAGIVLWEITKQRKKTGLDWGLEKNEKKSLMKSFMSRAKGKKG